MKPLTLSALLFAVFAVNSVLFDPLEARAQTTLTYTFPQSFNVSLPTTNPCCTYSWGITSVDNDPSITGQATVLNISVSGSAVVTGAPTGGFDWIVLVGSSPFGFPDSGEIFVNSGDNPFSLSPTAPVQFHFAEQPGGSAVINGSYDFTSNAFSTPCCGVNRLVSATASPLNVTNGLYVQMLLYTGDPNTIMTVSNLQVTLQLSNGCTRAGQADIRLKNTCWWPSSSPIWSQPFTNGSKLEVTCQLDTNVAGAFPFPALMLWYTDPQGNSSRIAQCLFQGGVNDAQYTFGTDSNGNQSCLASSHWENIDGGLNDNKAIIADDFAGNQFVFVTPDEPYLDIVQYDYDANANKLSWRDQKYPYPNNTMIADQAVINQVWDGGILPVHGLGVSVDPTVGSGTEHLFDQAYEELQTIAFEPEQFITGCDLNGDGVCDSTDQSLLNAATGTCLGQAGYSERADVDHDGCVATADVTAVQASFSYYRAGCTRTKGYWLNHPSAWPTRSLTIGNQSYNQTQLIQILGTPINGNGALSLADQMIAAKLNIAAGASPVAASLGTADSLILNLAPGLLPPLGSASVPTSTTSPWVNLLNSYNQGLIGPPACTK